MQGKRIFILILILGLLSGCQPQAQKSAEQQFLQTLQRGQAELASLFENGQPQSSAWLQQLAIWAGSGAGSRNRITEATKRSRR